MLQKTGLIIPSKYQAFTGKNIKKESEKNQSL
jgi:hypothetical protein